VAVPSERIIALAVLRAAFLGGEYAQRLVSGTARVIERLRIFERNLLVVLACTTKNGQRIFCTTPSRQ
jgi:hypothetical protein